MPDRERFDSEVFPFDLAARGLALVGCEMIA